jgi:hypothetical protein
MLDRATLSRLLQGNQQAIFAFERILGDVDGVLPSTIEEANALAGQALAAAQAAMASLAILAEALAQLEGLPAAPPHVDPDDTAPRTHMGTLAAQNADDVDITGGIAALTSITITSTDRVDNLYADRAALADEATKLASPTTLPPAATDAASTQTLVNALRAAAITKGL